MFSSNFLFSYDLVQCSLSLLLSVSYTYHNAKFGVVRHNKKLTGSLVFECSHPVVFYSWIFN